jgi:hypothetical protein
MNLHFGQWLKWLRALSHIAKIPAYFRGYSKGISNQDCKALSKSEAFHTILIKPLVIGMRNAIYYFDYQ